MTRKDFELIAKTLGSLPKSLRLDSVDDRIKLYSIVAESLQSTNALFNRQRFVCACAKAEVGGV